MVDTAVLGNLLLRGAMLTDVPPDEHLRLKNKLAEERTRLLREQASKNNKISPRRMVSHFKEFEDRELKE